MFSRRQTRYKLNTFCKIDKFIWVEISKPALTGKNADALHKCLLKAVKVNILNEAISSSSIDATNFCQDAFNAEMAKIIQQIMRVRFNLDFRRRKDLQQKVK